MNYSQIEKEIFKWTVMNRQKTFRKPFKQRYKRKLELFLMWVRYYLNFFLKKEDVILSKYLNDRRKQQRYKKNRKKSGLNVYEWNIRRLECMKLNLIKYNCLKCEDCKEKLNKKTVTIDHIEKLAIHHNSELSNLQVLCRKCHIIKEHLPVDNSLDNLSK